MSRSAVQLWFEFASTYSYPAVQRIEALAGARGVLVEWKPFLLGPVFRSQGWNDSPFNIYPAKGRYIIFGAPSVVVGDELFWGNDRLEDAIAWAVLRPEHAGDRG